MGKDPAGKQESQTGFSVAGSGSGGGEGAGDRPNVENAVARARQVSSSSGHSGSVVASYRNDLENNNIPRSPLASITRSDFGDVRGGIGDSGRSRNHFGRENAKQGFEAGSGKREGTGGAREPKGMGGILVGGGGGEGGRGGGGGGGGGGDDEFDDFEDIFADVDLEVRTFGTRAHRHL